MYSSNAYPAEKEILVGFGIIGHLKALLIYLSGQRTRVTAYDRYAEGSETTTSNIFPSLTPDEIMSVVPVGKALTDALAIKFNEPGGIDTNITGINDSVASIDFINQVLNYSKDKQGHEDRQRSLLELGKLSMDMWQKIYEIADPRLKAILEDANFHSCREPDSLERSEFQHGYRIDIISNDSKAKDKVTGMVRDYQSLGYVRTRPLSPQEAMKLDPHLKDFCEKQTIKNQSGMSQWKDNAGAILRPGGCINTQKLLPALRKYLTDVMGTYTNEAGITKNCFKVKYSSEVVGVTSKQEGQNNYVDGLVIKDKEQVQRDHHHYQSSHYLFAPGEAVGTLKKLGFKDVATDAGFAGVSLTLTIPIPDNMQAEYKRFCQYQEVHQKGIVLAWQAQYDEQKKAVVIGVAGTKAYHGHVRPDVNGEFALDRGLVQLRMILGVLPKLLDLVLEKKSANRELNMEDLTYLESKNIAQRWAGVRALAADGYLTAGALSNENGELANASTITNLGSGGCSFGPAAVVQEEIIRVRRHPGLFYKPSVLTNMALEKEVLTDKVNMYARPTRRY